MSLAARLRLGILIVIGLALSCLPVVLFSGMVAAEGLSANAPHKANSDPNNVHVFYMRRGDNGQSDTTRLDAYYPATGSNALSNSQWNNTKIKIGTGPGDDVNFWRVCEAIGSNTNKFISVNLDSGVASVTYHIPKNRVCTEKSGDNSPGTNSSNAFFASYPLPNNGRPGADPRTENKYYRLQITISYNEAPSDAAGGIRFTINGGDDNSKIGPTGDDYSFPILAKWSSHTESTTKINIPFGMACNETGKKTKKIGIYDADNKSGEFADNDLTFQIYDTENNQLVKMDAGSAEGHGKMSADRKTFYFNTGGSGESAFAKFTMEERGKYEMRIKGLDPRNAIDVRVPAGTIFGDAELCTDGWNIRGNSYVKDQAGEWEEAGDELVTIPYNYGQSGYTGGSIISNAFKHRLKNFGNAGTGSQGIAWRIKWGQYGAPGNTYSGGNIDTSTTGGKTFNSKEEMVKDGAGMNNFAVPNDAQTGYRYCQYISWWPSKSELASNPSHPNYRKDSNPACVTIEREPCIEGTDAGCTNPTDPPIRYVNMKAEVTVAGNTETTTDAQFNGSVTISNFPAAEEGGWGYNERSSQHNAERVSSYKQRDATLDSDSRTIYYCPSGYTAASTPVTSSTQCEQPWTTYGCPAGSHSTSGGGCRANGCTGSSSECAVSPVVTDSGTYTTSPNSYNEYRYKCEETNSWTGWSTSSSDPCTDLYACPNGSSMTAYGSSTSALSCNVWQCKYPSAPAGRQSDPMKTQTNTYPCSFRCGGSNGDKAYLNPSYDDVAGTGDRRCFQQPEFTLTCYWDDGVMMTETVSGNGSYCNHTYYKTAGSIGNQVSAELKVKQVNPYNDSSWNPSNPAPGTVTSTSGAVSKMYRWRWTKEDDSAQTNVVGYSYTKIFGGDVRVGGGVGSIGGNGECLANGSAQIRTNNNGVDDGYSGSSVQYGVFAAGVIDRLISGRYNIYAADPDNGLNPKKLTFAGTSGEYGGGFGANGPCYDYTGRLSDAAVTETGNVTIGMQNITNGSTVIRHIVGNVFITGDTRYVGSGGTWPEPKNIPVYQLVVEGDIYISPNVKRLDGMYVAVPTSTTSGGRIYTCASNFGSPYSNAFTACNSQLVVNGSLSAKKVFMLRDCGSLAMSNIGEPWIESGGNDAQACSANNHAAEVINYTPEQWIRSSVGPASNRYDAISSMPPVL